MRLFVIVVVSAVVAIAECQYRRIKYREENYYERLYKRRMAEEEMQKFSQTAFQRRLGTAYTSKFPIIPPRLRLVENKQDEKKAEKDDIDPSSTNLSPASVLWELPRKHFNRIHDAATTVAPPEKLMRPRPTRPQAYSLDGFVPKPSNIEISIQPPNALITTPKKYISQHLKSLWGEAFLQKGGKKPKGKKEKEKFKKELLEKKFKTGSASNRRRSSKKGIPGVDYPVYVQIPESSFTCENKKIAGTYADKEAGCQVWHICTGVTKVAKARHSFLCAAGTIFSEKKGVCDWWYNVQC